MLKRQPSTTPDTVRVTFAVAQSAAPHVSVVGDFNGWDPLAHPLRKRSNGTRSVSIEVPAGACYEFKYLADGGSWFCEPDADRHSTNEYHEVNSVLVV